MGQGMVLMNFLETIPLKEVVKEGLQCHMANESGSMGDLFGAEMDVDGG